MTVEITARVLTALTEGRVHHDAVEPLLAKVDKGKATRGILGKECILVTLLLAQLGREREQRLLQPLCYLAEELLLVFAQTATRLIGSLYVGTLFLGVEERTIAATVHLTPVLAQVFYVVVDFLLHLEEQSSLTHILHLVPDGGEQPLHGLVQLSHQSFEQPLVARHRLGKHQMALGDDGAVGSVDTHLAIAALCTEPKAEGGYLQGTRVYLATVDVVLQNEKWHLTAERVTGMHLTVALKERGLVVPSVHIDIFHHLVEIKTEVHGATGGVERENLRRLFERALFQSFAEAVQHIAALLLADAALATRHLIPDAPQGVVRQEAHHVFGCEELVAHRHLTAVTRLVALLTHTAAFLQRVVVLKHPAQRLVLLPEVDGGAILLVIPCRELFAIDEFEQFQQCVLVGKEQGIGRETVEHRRQFHAQLVADAKQIPAVTLVTGRPRELCHGVVGCEASRVVAHAHTFQYEVALLAHAEGAETVELGESLFGDELVHGSTCLVGVTLGLGSLDVGKAVAQHTGSMHNVCVLTGQLFHGDGVAVVNPDAVVLLQQFGHVAHEQLFGSHHEAFKYFLSVLRNHILAG